MQTHIATPLDGFYQRPKERPATDDPQVETRAAALHQRSRREGRPAVFVEYFSPFTPKHASPAPRPRSAVIYGEDGELAIDFCEGSTASGACPRSLTPSGCVQCAGLWLGGSGWKFKAAQDAVVCPLVSLGIA